VLIGSAAPSKQQTLDVLKEAMHGDVRVPPREPPKAGICGRQYND
jgi:hypothetical protein